VREKFGTIAVIEDDASMCRSITRLLDAYGFATEAFPSGEAFLNRESILDVVCMILDIQLEGMSGIDLRHTLEMSGTRIPTIFITAMDNETLKQQAMNTGCVAYLHKPFSAYALIQAVKRSLASPV
jgi:FixJ family two-component response regulator